MSLGSKHALHTHEDTKVNTAFLNYVFPFVMLDGKMQQARRRCRGGT